METERLLIQRQFTYYQLYEKHLYLGQNGNPIRIMVGGVQAHTFRGESTDLGWMVYPGFRNKGYMKEALKIIVPDIFASWPVEFLRVWISKSNPCGSYSERAALSVGFSYTHETSLERWFRLDREKLNEQRRVLERNQKVDREGLDTASIR